ncbi:GNAT family N-acetyltransferase [Streptomyces sp. NBC_01433]|uniref:GNAT family N-acetyltransferase n=1 Tax=Streptomyces sp. NBC_01433 TaxID=2903864 RepID=UPI002258D71A|nr:GNAT family N-acetyltransferase [Streptomyces sp. NBC_01433]MCX4681386.1 GNAT family N-acetyltransferase [Streptomyces sp. NBC_01433]
MTHTAVLPNQPRTARTDIAPLTRPDHADYLALLALTTSSGRLPAGTGEILTMDPVGPLSTHGTALCLTARLRRSTNPKPVGAVFASSPDLAFQHPLVRADPGLSHVISRTVLLVYGVAVAPARRRQGIARTLLTETENRARATGYRMTTLIHTPDLALFYERLGYTTAHQITIAMPDAAMGLTQPPPYMTAVKALSPDVQVRTLPGAPGPVVTGLLPSWHLPTGA